MASAAAVLVLGISLECTCKLRGHREPETSPVRLMCASWAFLVRPLVSGVYISDLGRCHIPDPAVYESPACCTTQLTTPPPLPHEVLTEKAALINAQ